MKTITQEQIDKIMKSLMDCNIPVQVFVGIQDLLVKLPESNPKENDKPNK